MYMYIDFFFYYYKDKFIQKNLSVSRNFRLNISNRICLLDRQNIHYFMREV